MVSASTILTDSIKVIRGIVDDVTDPVSSVRPSDSKFVVTSWPLRTTFYPVITIRSDGMEEIHSSGFKSELMWIRLSFAIRVWARNEVEKEKLTEQLLDKLRLAQFDGGAATSDDENMHDFKIESIVHVDEQDENGIAGIRSAIIRISYKHMLGS